MKDDVTDHMAQKVVLTIFRLIVPNNLAIKNDLRAKATWLIMSLWCSITETLIKLNMRTSGALTERIVP